MRVHVVAGTELDVCDACGCVYFEYFDGEPGALARSLRPLLKPRATPAIDRLSGCPECGGELALRSYLDDGPQLYRCTACLGVFATPGMLGALAVYREAPAPKEPEPTLLDRILRYFQGD